VSAITQSVVRKRDPPFFEKINGYQLLAVAHDWLDERVLCVLVFVVGGRRQTDPFLHAAMLLDSEEN